jgi:hypothetical protein
MSDATVGLRCGSKGMNQEMEGWGFNPAVSKRRKMGFSPWSQWLDRSIAHNRAQRIS